MSNLICTLLATCLVTPALRSHAEDFEDALRVDTSGVAMGIVSRPTTEIDPDNIGECHRDPPRIWIERGFWKNASEASRRALVWHELGHCVLGLGHAEGTVENPNGIECPASLMNHNIGDGECYDEPVEWRWYVEELRRRADPLNILPVGHPRPKWSPESPRGPFESLVHILW